MEKKSIIEHLKPSDYQAPCGQKSHFIRKWEGETLLVKFNTPICNGCALEALPDGSFDHFLMSFPFCGNEGWVIVKGEQTFYWDKKKDYRE